MKIDRNILILIACGLVAVWLILRKARASVAGPVGSLDAVIDKLARALKQQEGWYDGSRSYRNNNPGNIKSDGPPSHLVGALGLDESGFVVFDTYENGWAALIRQLGLVFSGQSNFYSPDDTFYDFISQWAYGDSEEKQNAYAEKLAAKMGVSPDRTLGSLVN
jgi:hypothetical protein